MNEYLFYHLPSKTLIASDGYYGGYTTSAQPDWFGRVWFKCTKGTFKEAKLPIYRTARILTHGDIDMLMTCAKKLTEKWDFNCIIHAHGTNFWPRNPAQSFLAGWEQVLAMREKASAASRRTKRKRVQGAPGESVCGNQTYSLLAPSAESGAEKARVHAVEQKTATKPSYAGTIGNQTYSLYSEPQGIAQSAL